jgi:ABC-2 type transport system permease protein
MTTVMIPALMAMFIFGSILLGGRANSTVHIAVVSQDTQLASDLKAEVARQEKRETEQVDQRAEAPTSLEHAKKHHSIVLQTMVPGPDTRANLDRELDRGELDGYLWIASAASADAVPSVTFMPRGLGLDSVKDRLDSAMQNVLVRETLSRKGVTSSESEWMLQPVVQTTVPKAGADDRMSAEVCVSVLFFLMYLVIMLYGMNVARSVIEEKTSRIFEVLLSTVRPEAMMGGKLIGVGAVGLTQVGIWICGVLLLAASTSGIHLGSDTVHVALTGPQIVFFFVYFLLGYLFYSSIAAALGAMTSSEQELQQLNMFLVMPLLFCFVLLGTLLTNPDGTLSRVLALVPPFTPLLMYMRVSLGHPLKTEVIASIVLTGVSIAGIIWVTSRIYRVGVLMYGKRPNLAEVRRWLKYS